MSEITEYPSLEYYLKPAPDSYNALNPPLPHEAVAWRKLRGRYWTCWSWYGRYSWANIRKWVVKRGDIYQIALANGQVITAKRAVAS